MVTIVTIYRFSYLNIGLSAGRDALGCHGMGWDRVGQGGMPWDAIGCSRTGHPRSSSIGWDRIGHPR